MMRRSLAGLSVILATLIVARPSCTTVTGKTAGESIDDASITVAVKAKLAEDEISTLTRVAVETNLRTVYLAGVVETEAVRARAEALARSVKGVRDVVNNLSVRSSGTSPMALNA